MLSGENPGGVCGIFFCTGRLITLIRALKENRAGLMLLLAFACGLLYNVSGIWENVPF